VKILDLKIFRFVMFPDVNSEKIKITAVCSHQSCTELGCKGVCFLVLTERERVACIFRDRGPNVLVLECLDCCFSGNCSQTKARRKPREQPSVSRYVGQHATIPLCVNSYRLLCLPVKFLSLSVERSHSFYSF
jgi:hypothetical protein